MIIMIIIRKTIMIMIIIPATLTIILLERTTTSRTGRWTTTTSERAPAPLGFGPLRSGGLCTPAEVRMAM